MAFPLNTFDIHKLNTQYSDLTLQVQCTAHSQATKVYTSHDTKVGQTYIEKNLASSFQDPTNRSASRELKKNVKHVYERLLQGIRAKPTP